MLSLEFLVIFSLSLGYVAFSLGLADRLGDAMNARVMELTLDDISEKLEFAARSRGVFEFDMKLLNDMRAAVWSEGSSTKVAVCGGGMVRETTLDMPSVSGVRPESCDDFPDVDVLAMTNDGVVRVESPVVD